MLEVGVLFEVKRAVPLLVVDGHLEGKKDGLTFTTNRGVSRVGVLFPQQHHKIALGLRVANAESVQDHEILRAPVNTDRDWSNCMSH